MMEEEDQDGGNIFKSDAQNLKKSNQEGQGEVVAKIKSLEKKVEENDHKLDEIMMKLEMII